jgi:hypothetical protein
LNSPEETGTPDLLGAMPSRHERRCFVSLDTLRCGRIVGAFDH